MLSKSANGLRVANLDVFCRIESVSEVCLFLLRMTTPELLSALVMWMLLLHPRDLIV